MKSKNTTRYVILGLLSEAPLSGYDIKKIINIRFSSFWSESYGQIYPELKRMEQEGLVEKAASDAGRVTYIYSITRKGMSVLKEWLDKPAEKEIIRYEILLKIYFGNLETPEKLEEHIKAFTEAHSKELFKLQQFEKELTPIVNEHENHKFILLTILFGQKVYQAYMDWAQEALKLINSSKKSN